jgi:isopentenyldiphosphate isomerase
MKSLLNIVNENDEIIGTEEREEIHRRGLLHREIHVYFLTPDKKFIFQHRAPDKDSYPDLLDATVGGHVEIGDSYLETAIKETLEETGLNLKSEDFIFINKTRRHSEDPATGKINNVFGESYAYIFKGDARDLKVETGKAVGFETWAIDKLMDLNDEEKSRFIPYILEFSKTILIELSNNL